MQVTCAYALIGFSQIPPISADQLVLEVIVLSAWNRPAASVLAPFGTVTARPAGAGFHVPSADFQVTAPLNFRLVP